MKPDGWHIYHVCGGLLREVTRITDEDQNASLTCVHCGEWLDWTIRAERRPAEPLVVVGQGEPA